MASYTTEGKAQNLEKELFICYGKIAPETVKGYGLVILEAQHYSTQDIEVFKKHNHKVLAYLSLTEVHKTAVHYSAINPYTLGKNNNWDSYFIDISNNKAKKILLSLITDLSTKGFDGLFLDNLDNVSQWGQLKDKEADLLNLIKRIKRQNKKSYSYSEFWAVYG